MSCPAKTATSSPPQVLLEARKPRPDWLTCLLQSDQSCTAVEERATNGWEIACVVVVLADLKSGFTEQKSDVLNPVPIPNMAD